MWAWPRPVHACGLLGAWKVRVPKGWAAPYTGWQRLYESENVNHVTDNFLLTLYLGHIDTSAKRDPLYDFLFLFRAWLLEN